MKISTAFHALLVLIALGTFEPRASAAEYRTEPSILVFFTQNKDAVEKPVILQAVDGYTANVSEGGGECFCGDAANASGPNGTSHSYFCSASYTVVSTHPGHFIVQAHYDITWDGISTKVDQTLPVMENRPDQAKWFKVDNRFMAFACLSKNATR